MAKQKYTPVTFQNSRGETISNDPVFLAQQTLAAHGVEDTSAPASTRTAPADGDMPEDESPYDSMDGKALKELAKTRNVDIKGLKKLSEVRAAFVAADEAEAEEEADEEDEDDDEANNENTGSQE